VIVVDTNVVAYLLIQGDQTKAVQALFARDDDWHTEPFALVELNNLLATACRARGLTSARARRLLESADELLRGRMHTVSHQVALAVANEYSISAYDARFIALAEQVDTPLVTEDARLRRAVPDRTLSVSEAVSVA
jgi:predicted nucleic acid-binding protein